MKKYLTIILTILLMASCTKKEEKTRTIPPADELIKIAHEYMDLAAKRNIFFVKDTRVGFSYIQKPSVVGMCQFGNSYRTILIDTQFWGAQRPRVKKQLMFHELTHCLCGRDHDFGDGEKYLSPVEEVLLHGLGKPSVFRIRGYYSDGCPLSIMYPTVIDEVCFKDHEAEYIEEMFSRCEPW